MPSPASPASPIASRCGAAARRAAPSAPTAPTGTRRGARARRCGRGTSARPWMTEPVAAVPAVPDDDPDGMAPAPRWGLGDAALAFVAGILGTLVTTALYVGVSGNDV